MQDKKHSAHYWIQKHFGKAYQCDFCGNDDVKRYEWSNRNHLYNKIREEWQMLCKPCHANYDIKMGLRNYDGYHDSWVGGGKSNTCRFCSHDWFSRKKKPKACPRCKRYDWDKKQKDALP